MKGDRFQQKSFSVPASAGKLETCVRDGHAMPDAKGRCLRCGGKVRYIDATTDRHAPPNVTYVVEDE